MAVHPYQIIKENPMHYVTMPRYSEFKKGKNDLKVIEDFNRIISRFPEGSNFYVPL